MRGFIKMIDFRYHPDQHSLVWRNRAQNILNRSLHQSDNDTISSPLWKRGVRANLMLFVKLTIKDNKLWEGEWKCCVMVFCPLVLLWQTVRRWWRLCSLMKHWGSVVHTNRHLFNRWLKCLYLTWITASTLQSAAILTQPWHWSDVLGNVSQDTTY